MNKGLKEVTTFGKRREQRPRYKGRDTILKRQKKNQINRKGENREKGHRAKRREWV